MTFDAADYLRTLREREPEPYTPDPETLDAVLAVLLDVLDVDLDGFLALDLRSR